MSVEQKVIEEVYGGDVRRFKADFAEMDLHAVHWNDLIVDATTLPHLKDIGQILIKINLGYLPPADVMLPFEPYLRAMIQSYWNGQIAEDDFYDQVEGHVKLIRNADMKHNTYLEYDESIYRNYYANFAMYGYAVRERVSRFLGYEPQLKHSLIAELWMRDIMSNDTYKMPAVATDDDARAITLIKYREILLEHGQGVASQSSLIGML
ncbi:hypothetical protein [Spirosoma sordidisoli]|uniref:Uncharacterized protein n=1 Tax=Spirosoma sordidisoli TaxID=2502893 RepID=A0A4Q2UDE0_9BACT|nr:hypothetical protein [Spirosoma sordidisoli]RYC66944.1 hypothetical protein EQG79_26565 [Spirosoma sordidisoli]